jgi:hypothetical protein
MTLPPILRRAWQGWKRFALWLGDKQATLIYTVLYFVMIGPVALGRRAFTDPLLVRARHRETFWRPRPETPPTLAEARRQ